MTRHGFLPILTAAALWLSASAHAAGERDGVVCPQGFSATVFDANTRLVCEGQRTEVRASICRREAFGSMTINGTIVLDPVGLNGVDQCSVVGVADLRAESIMWPAEPPGASGTTRKAPWTRVVKAAAVDEFQSSVNTQVLAVMPGGQLLPVTVSNPRDGVRCPAGALGESTNGGKGIRCRVAARAALVSCERTENLVPDRNGMEDRCVSSSGERGSKPQDLSRAQFDAERARSNVDWSLLRVPGGDRWERKEFVFPR